MNKKIKLVEICRISPPAIHAAFTDLIDNPFDKSSNSLLCCYRQATNHVSRDGVIVILTVSKKTFEVVSKVLVNEPGTDLRDPKLMFDGHRIILTAFAKTIDENDQAHTKMLSIFTTTGKSWSSKHWFGDNGWWIWKPQWTNNKAFGFAYHRPADYISLYEGDPTRAMRIHKANVFGLAKNNKGFPNESALLFDAEGQATAFVRRDSDTFSAQFGTSRPPYTKWNWHDLGIYIGGPCAVALTATTYLVAGRHVDWEKRAFSTCVWHFDATKKELTCLLTMPSSGDTSYPGLVLDNDLLYISYYSSHVDNQARVYLGKIEGIKTLF
ncbi:hypothetical protein E5672_02230 [Alteromonas portus]|uniref:DUF1861 family protein n=1 Tax=Alteromonas portus TaxID=2565549 RepID=A0A4U0ZRE2_9ALTE|nr:hypothetical protein [Alteromonas portus]TKB04931.1 hypothetical protein E5672_02230 [Alteromonas portus]